MVDMNSPFEKQKGKIALFMQFPMTKLKVRFK